jgi:hypothetical protein
MSGGHFDYVQHRIAGVAEALTRDAELWSHPHCDEWRPDDEPLPAYPPEITSAFKSAAKLCEAAALAVRDVDWLLSGDDGEETFLAHAEKWRHLAGDGAPDN